MTSNELVGQIYVIADSYMKIYANNCIRVLLSLKQFLPFNELKTFFFTSADSHILKTYLITHAIFSIIIHIISGLKIGKKDKSSLQMQRKN